MLRTDDLNYELPEGLIATEPASPRDAARLMVLSRSDPTFLLHRHVRDLPACLRPGDLLVVNVSRVIPARFRGVRADTQGKVEGLYLGPPDETASPNDPALWRVMLRGRRIRAGVRIQLWDRHGQESGLALEVLRPVPRAEDEEGAGAWIVRAEDATKHEAEPAVRVLERIGLTPLPPYILAARRRGHAPGDEHEAPVDDQHAAAAIEALEDDDRERYQTVYASAAQTGSVAAPTAGLHFTPDLLARLHATGVQRAEVVLHVGTGTFKPVETEFIEQHPMHSEWCEVPAETARLIERTRAAGGRVVAVGTTSARTLESFSRADLAGAAANGQVSAKWTRILITPGYAWQNIDGLMTNFHLPRSTLLAMVSAMFHGGVAQAQAAYAVALRERYRFYSYGDAMLIT